MARLGSARPVPEPPRGRESGAVTPAAGSPGRCRSRPLRWGRLRRSAQVARTTAAAQLCAPGRRRRRRRHRGKFPGPRSSPPLVLLSGVGGREAAPQRREPGAASAQRLRPGPKDRGGAVSADPFASTRKPGGRAEYRPGACQVSVRQPLCVPNPPHFMSQTIHILRAWRSAGAVGNPRRVEPGPDDHCWKPTTKGVGRRQTC